MKAVLLIDTHALKNGQNPSYPTCCGWLVWVITLLGCVSLVCVFSPGPRSDGQCRMLQSAWRDARKVCG